MLAPPPEGAELVLEIGELEIYDALEGEPCAGTLRRIELHALGLAELFHMDPPRARVFLHADAAAIDTACNFPMAVRGCTDWWGANSLPIAVTHELAHVFVNEAVGHVETKRMLEEGLAYRLDGTRVESPARPVEPLETLLTAEAAEDLDRLHSRLFVAWAMHKLGPEALLDAFVATSEADSDAQVALALATSLGFASLADLQADFDTTRAYAYPPLPDTTHVLFAAELASGIVLDTSCHAPFAEGPTEDQATVITRVEVLEAGQYEVAHAPIPFPEPDLWLLPSEPVYDEELALSKAESCPFDVPVPRFVFPVAGQYELTITRPLDEPLQIPLSIRRIPGDRCTSD